MRNRENSNHRAWLGVFLVLFGGYFLLRNFHLIPAFIPHYLFGWEMVVIIIGASMVLTGRREGFVFLLIGCFFLIDEIFYLPDFHFRDWWPLILVALGLSIILRRRDGAHRGIALDDDYLEDSAIFGGSEKSFTSKNFKGGKITAIFGGSEISFAQAELAEKEAVLDIFCMFGGSSFHVPDDWTVINESFVIFGGYSDNRSNTPRDPNKVLRIKGSVVFGGAEVKGA